MPKREVITFQVDLKTEHVTIEGNLAASAIVIRKFALDSENKAKTYERLYKLAKDVIKKTPCDPDIFSEQIKAVRILKAAEEVFRIDTAITSKPLVNKDNI